MKTQIGNLPPGAEIEVIFTYLELLEVSMAKFWKFAVYSTLSPRYAPSTSKQMSKMDVEGIQKGSLAPMSTIWDINITVQSAQPISLL